MRTALERFLLERFKATFTALGGPQDQLSNSVVVPGRDNTGSSIHGAILYKRIPYRLCRSVRLVGLVLE